MSQSFSLRGQASLYAYESLCSAKTSHRVLLLLKKKSLSVILFLFLASETETTCVICALTFYCSSYTFESEQRARLSHFLPIPAVLILAAHRSVCVFPQGLQENVEGWEEEGILVSNAHQMISLFIFPFNLFSWNTVFFFFFFTALTHCPSFPCVTGYVGGEGPVKAVIHESGHWMMGCSWPLSLSLSICADIVLTLAMWFH